jgi:hypothetical protein
MFAEMNQVFTGADVQYRRERLAADISRHRRGRWFRTGWPTIIRQPWPPQPPRPIPAPHHHMSTAA